MIPHLLKSRAASVTRCTVCCAIIGLLLGTQAQSQEPQQQQPLVREIFVPFDDLNVLLEGAPQHVFLSREDYEKLLGEAAQRPGAVAPIATSILNADYRIAISEGRAAIAADLTIDVLAEGIHAVPLAAAGVGLKSVMIDDVNAAVGRSPDGQFVLFITGRGTHRVHLEMTAMVQTSAAQQVLQVQLPTTASSHLQLTVPGNVE